MTNLARARRRILPSRVNDSDYFPFEGGLNLVDTPLKIRPGQLLATKNYEPGIRGGYRSVKGYERYDGHTEPSQAQYWLLGYKSATQVAPVGAILSQGASNAVVLKSEVTQPVTTINLLSGSEDLSTWTASGGTIATNQSPNPINGDLTADLLREGSGLNEFIATRTLTKPAGEQVYWLSMYVRAGGRSRAQIQVGSVALPANYALTQFDLLNRVIDAAIDTAAFVALGQYMLDVGGGYMRVGLKFRASSETQMQVVLRLADSGGATTYVGDGAAGMLFFGMQLETTEEDSIAPSAYVPADSEARGNGAGYYVLARLSGDYTDATNLMVGSETIAVTDGTETADDASTDALDLEYSQLAITDARNQIQAVPGDGPVLGTVVYNGAVYAVRNTTDKSAARMFRSTPTGWAPVSLGRKLRFDTGLVEIREGDTVVGATSGAFGVVHRVSKQTGSWGSDAAGYLILPTVTGLFQGNETLSVSGVDVGTADGADVRQDFAPSGTFEFRVHNFYGHAKQRRLYGVDGASRAFEYQDNPEFFCQIETGMTFDTPNHLGVHQNQLFLSFRGGSVQKSGVGDPISWQVSLGAAELGIGDDVTGFMEQIGNTLFIFARSSTHYLFGDPANYSLLPYNSEVGAFAGSIQRIGKGMYLDDRGFSTLAASDSYGNFAYNSISAVIQPLIKQLKLKVTTSVTVKDDNLYRVFFNDGRFISVGVQDKKISGFMSCEYAHVVRCAFAGEDPTGEQMIVFGSDNGMVYRAERGTSFDGAEIETFLRPVYFFSRSPSRRKRYRRAQFDMTATGDTTIDVAVDYSFGDGDDPAEAVRRVQLGGGGGIWGAAIWGQFKWGAGAAPEAIVKLEGSGINIGFLIASHSAVSPPHSIEGVTLHHSLRRINRGTSYA